MIVHTDISISWNLNKYIFWMKDLCNTEVVLSCAISLREIQFIVFHFLLFFGISFSIEKAKECGPPETDY